eukprot:CAMPEP_0178371190 /NCGR_PEP_ID=MMETSP0689_2-20121128/697_1 /TAXON_ID=160604 /ORGANISM="Amphidinium massartii, Strain CS-259" /LENGTH=300 /DNA_ID=CAMNT_0019991049 /DNA_START=39 /DNA_END=941 /DNA_ORIENTATION=-
MGCAHSADSGTGVIAAQPSKASGVRLVSEKKAVQYSITLQRRANQRLGMDLQIDPSTCDALIVMGISSDSAVREWPGCQDVQEVQTHDRIIAVNSIVGDCAQMLMMLTHEGVMTIKFERRLLPVSMPPSPAATLPVQTRGLGSLVSAASRFNIPSRSSTIFRSLFASSRSSDCGTSTSGSGSKSRANYSSNASHPSSGPSVFLTQSSSKSGEGEAHAVAHPNPLIMQQVSFSGQLSIIAANVPTDKTFKVEDAISEEAASDVCSSLTLSKDLTSTCTEKLAVRSGAGVNSEAARTYKLAL